MTDTMLMNIYYIEILCSFTKSFIFLALTAFILAVQEDINTTFAVFRISKSLQSSQLGLKNTLIGFDDEAPVLGLWGYPIIAVTPRSTFTQKC